MPHHKKKPGSKHNQKVLAAQYHNEFIRKMKFVIDNICGKDIFPMLPKDFLDFGYKFRSTPFKFRADVFSNIPSNVVNSSKAVITKLIKDHSILLPPNQLKISLNDYYTVVMTIMILQKYIEENTFNNALIVKKAFMHFVNDQATYNNANLMLFDIFNIFNTNISDLRKTLYWNKHELIIADNIYSENENIISIFAVSPEKINVKVDGNSRPAIRVGWAIAYTGPVWISIKPSELGYKSPFAEIPLNVYIQTHALNRLVERIDCFKVGLVYLNLFLSMQNLKIAYDNKHNLLIEYYYFEYKAGYFRADIIDGIILIRTFLFITNNGTPEGQLLEKNTGIQKLDKDYLNIDKLSTLMNSDLGKNEEAQRIFINSGCKCLIDLYNNTNDLLTKRDNIFHFNKMLTYLKKDNISTPYAEDVIPKQYETD
jgi:hypothetical protein